MMKATASVCLLSVLCAGAAQAAETFTFTHNANGLTGTAGGTLLGVETDLALAVTRPGSLIDESDSDGMGINSTGIAGVIDSSGSKFNTLAGAAAGQGESITFSFSQPGVLEGLLFDGLKDETLEHFILTLPNGTVLTLFDFEAEMRLNDQGFQLSDMGVPNPTQAVDSSDDILNLAIPFAAGEVFTLTYGEVDYDGAVLPGYYPADDNLNPTGDEPNGARFEGVVVSPVPEPASAMIGLLALGACTTRRQR